MSRVKRTVRVLGAGKAFKKGTLKLVEIAVPKDFSVKISKGTSKVYVTMYKKRYPKR